MSENKRRFFSGNTIQQAVMAAASAYGLDPREVNFQPVEKKRGFLKVRKRIIIEVDQEQPRLDEPRDELFNDGPKGLAPVIGEPVPGRKKEEPAAPVGEKAVEKKAEAPRRPAVEEAAEGSGHVQEEAAEVRVAAASEEEDDQDRKPRRRGGRPERRRQDRKESQGREEAEDRSTGDDDSEDAPSRSRRPRQRRGRGGGRNQESAKASKGKQRPGRIEGLSVEEEALARLLDLADLDLEWELWREEDVLHVELTGEDSDLVLSDEGSVLYSLEHLLPQLIRGIDGEDVFCQVDCDGYRKDREEELRELARNSAAWVVENDREKTLRELNPAERRIVHMELADHSDVETESEGRGYRKRLTIWPL